MSRPFLSGPPIPLFAMEGVIANPGYSFVCLWLFCFLRCDWFVLWMDSFPLRFVFWHIDCFRCTVPPIKGLFHRWFLGITCHGSGAMYRNSTALWDQHPSSFSVIIRFSIVCRHISNGLSHRSMMISPSRWSCGSMLWVTRTCRRSMRSKRGSSSAGVMHPTNAGFGTGSPMREYSIWSGKLDSSFDSLHQPSGSTVTRCISQPILDWRTGLQDPIQETATNEPWYFRACYLSISARRTPFWIQS